MRCIQIGSISVLPSPPDPDSGRPVRPPRARPKDWVLDRQHRHRYIPVSILDFTSISLNSSPGLLFGALIGSFAALVSPEFVQWLSVIFFGALLIAMLLFLEETAFDRSTEFPAEANATELPWLNFTRTNTHGLKRTSMLETITHVLKLSTYPNIAIPVIAYSWTWYLVSRLP